MDDGLVSRFWGVIKGCAPEHLGSPVKSSRAPVSVYTIPLYSLNCNLDVTDGPGILSQPMYLCLAAVSVSMTGQPMNRCPGHVRDPFKIGSSQSITVQQLNNQ